MQTLGVIYIQGIWCFRVTDQKVLFKAEVRQLGSHGRPCRLKDEDFSTRCLLRKLKRNRHTCAHCGCEVMAADLAELVHKYGPLTVCGIPRSKRESIYPAEKMGLKRAIRKAVASIPQLTDGLDYIVRHTNTKCTHRSYWGHGGDGEMPRPGLLRDTCSLSPAIAGKRIVLVDDIYTPGVGIDEDGVQALFDAGARSVILYTFGYTVKKYGCVA